MCHAIPWCVTSRSSVRPANKLVWVANVKCRFNVWMSGRRVKRSRDGSERPFGMQKRATISDAITVQVKGESEAGRPCGARGTSGVMRNVGESGIVYALSNADAAIPLIEMVRARRQRHRIEELFGRARVKRLWVSRRCGVG